MNRRAHFIYFTQVLTIVEIISNLLLRKNINGICEIFLLFFNHHLWEICVQACLLHSENLNIFGSFKVKWKQKNLLFSNHISWKSRIGKIKMHSIRWRIQSRFFPRNLITKLKIITAYLSNINSTSNPKLVLGYLK